MSKFSYACGPSYFYFYVIINLLFNYDGCEEFLSIFFKCMKYVVPGRFSGTLLKNQNKTFSFLLFYIYLITMTDFYKVSYSEDPESQENMKKKRSTTSIKMQGDLYPREVIISVLTDSSIDKRYLCIGDGQHA
jgi:hypothetical protein